MMAAGETVAAGVVVLLCCLAAWRDLRTREIEDHFAATIALLYVALALPALVAGTLAPIALAWAVGGAVAVFLVTLALFCLGWLGGADVKLLSAIMPWILPSAVAHFLALVAIAGGVLALALVVALVVVRIRGRNQGFMNRYFTSLGDDRAAVPYGLAIAVGVVGTWLGGGLGLPLVPA